MEFFIGILGAALFLAVLIWLGWPPRRRRRRRNIATFDTTIGPPATD